MIKPNLKSWLALGLTLSLLAGCKGGDATKAQGGPRPALVTVEAAVREAAPLQVEAVGHVTAVESVAVRPQVGGTLTRIGFKEGDDIQKGQLLFQLDDRPLKATLSQAQATLARDKAQAKRAAEQLSRYAALYKDGGVSQDQYDQFRTQAAALESTVAAGEAAVEQVRVQLGYAAIRSPIAGRAGKRLVTEGNLVRANDSEPLVVIHQLSPIDVAFSVPETELARIRQRQAKTPLPVSVRIDGDMGAPIEGQLSFIDNAVNAGSGTIDLRGRFTNADKRLWPGQFVRVTLTVDVEPDAVLVPAHAVQTGQDGSFVFVVTADSKAEARPVTVARTLGDRSVIASGLQAGETVVTDGQLQVVPGGPVKIAEQAQGQAGGSDAAAKPAALSGGH